MDDPADTGASPSAGGAPPRPWRARILRLLPYLVFVVASVAFAPTAATGRAGLAPFDLIERDAPYRDTLGRDPHSISPIQGDQIEWTPNVVKTWRDLVHFRWESFSPAVGGGQPTGALPVFGVYSVFNVGFAFLPPWLAMSVRIFGLLIATQIGCYLFTRRVGFGAAASTFVAVVYTFNGSQLALINRLVAATLVPWLLLAIVRSIERPSIGRLLGVSAVVTALWFEGYVPAFVYALAIAGVFLVVALVWHLVVESPRRYSWRGALLRLGAVGAAVGLGLGIAAFCVFTFASDISSSGNLEKRTYDSTSHLPQAQFWGMLDESTYGDPVAGGVATGINSVEGIDQMGVVALAFAGVALVGMVVGRIGVPRPARLAVVLSLVGTPLVLCMMYFGTPLLGLFYKIPVLGDAPASRLRFLAGWGLAVIGAVAVEALVGCAVSARASIRLRVLGVVCALATLAMAAVSYHDFRDVVRRSGGMGLVAGQLVDGALLALVAAAAVWVVRSDRRAESVAMVVLGGALVVDLAVPMRNFQAQVPKTLDDFRVTHLHRELTTRAGHRYRVSASDSNLPWNASLLYGYLDLRGHGLYTSDYKRFVSAAAPVAFTRDPLKMILTRDEWNPSSPIWDEMALRYLVLASDEQPFGREAAAASTDEPSAWQELHAGPNTLAIDGTDAAPVGVGLRIRESGPCPGGRRLGVTVMDDAGHTRHVTRALAAKLTGDAPQWFALVGDDLEPGRWNVRLDLAPQGGCHVEVGRTGPESLLANRLIVDDPNDGVTLVDDVDGQLYERPSARPLVEASTSWTSVSGLDDAIARLTSGRAPRSGRGLLVEGAGDASSRARATLSRTSVAGSEVRTRLSSDAPAVVAARIDARSGFVATVDGRDAKLVRVDGFQLGVVVPAGRHDVVFSYEPVTLTIGAWLSLASLVACGGLLLLARRRQPIVAWCERWDRPAG